MTPQPRHIEAAEKIVEDLIVNGGFVLQRYKSAKIIALALASAENRAAWDGWDAGRNAGEHYWHGNTQRADYLIEMHAETYGPRPSRGEVGNE